MTGLGPGDYRPSGMTLQSALLAWLAYLSTLGVDMRAQLNPPATDAQVAAAEAATGDRLPDDVRALYLFANGQQFPDDFMRTRPGSTTAFLFGNYEFIDLAEAVRSPGRPGWFPFASDGGGNFYAVVLSPAAGESRGAIIVTGRDEDRRVLAPSLTAFFAQAAARRPPLSDRDGHWIAVDMEEGQ